MSSVDSEQFSLRWNNFHSNLSTGFHTLFEEEGLVDVTLAAEGKFVQAHKLVLSVCSPYLKELFKVNPCKHPIVILPKDVGHKELNDILQFMYKGEVNVKQEDLSTFLKTAELLQVKGLTHDDEASEKDEVLPSPSLVALPGGTKAPRKPPLKVPQAPDKNTRTEISGEHLDTARLTPPFKRKRQEVPPPSPVPVSVKLSSSPQPPAIHSAAPSSNKHDSINFIEFTSPKEEPIDLDSDIEESDTNIEADMSIKDDSLMTLLGGESSQSQQDMAGMGIFGNFSSSSQEGLPPEAGQAKVLQHPFRRLSHDSSSAPCNLQRDQPFHPGEQPSHDTQPGSHGHQSFLGAPATPSHGQQQPFPRPHPGPEILPFSHGQQPFQVPPLISQDSLTPSDQHKEPLYHRPPHLPQDATPPSPSHWSKRLRTSFRDNQLRTLSNFFDKIQRPTAMQIESLAQETGLSKRVVQVWFQNTRSKWKRKMRMQEMGGEWSPSDQ